MQAPEHVNLATKLINITSMCQRVGKKRTTLWLWVQEGKFPSPLKMGNRTLGWTEKQYNQWLASLVEVK